jgi:site-specific DNA-methyltransferase (adenine-specific)
VRRAKVGKHSEKPAEFRDDIIELCGDVPRVELFARERVDGWDAWGNEVHDSLLLEAL